METTRPRYESTCGSKVLDLFATDDARRIRIAVPQLPRPDCNDGTTMTG